MNPRRRGALVVANVYTYSITTAATDLAGNSLDAQTDAEFSTAREISTKISKHATLTGDIDGAGGISVGNARAGDFAANTQVRALLTFDLAALPASPIAVVSATLKGSQFVLNGQTPYASLGGELRLARVSYAALDASAFDVAADADLGVIATSKDDAVNVDVKSSVEAVLPGGDHAQFRTTFPTATNGDNAPDVLSILTPELDVVVLVE